MFNVEDYNISLSRGDTGALRVNATATLNGEPFTFGSDDRALFSIKNANGEIIMQKAYQMTNNAYTVYFLNADTDALSPGAYQWDVRYIIHPYYNSEGQIVDGDQVITPKQPLTMTLLTVVGDV